MQDTFTSTLELYDDSKGYSDMAKSVDLTCGIATQLLLNGHPILNVSGIIDLNQKGIYNPTRKLLEKNEIA